MQQATGSLPAMAAPAGPRAWLRLLQASAWGEAAALAAGGALTLAFAPYGLWPLGVLAPALLFLLWLHQRPRRAWGRGLLFGLGLFGTGTAWVFDAIHGPGGVGLGLSLLLTALLVGLLALFPAAAGWAAARLGTRLPPGARLALLFPALWTLAEWVRGWFLTGFPWLALGYAQIDAPLAGWAPLGGAYGVSLAAAWSAGLLAALLGRGRRARLAALLGLALLWGGGAALRGVAWTAPAGPPVAVRLLQGNVPQELKWLPAMREPTLAFYEGLTREALGRARLVVWPESAVPAFYQEVAPRLEALGEEARAAGTAVLAGVLELDRATGRYYNSVALLGRPPRFYRKHHLVPFTEYLPLEALLGGAVDLLQVPMSDFSKGPADPPPLRAGGLALRVTVCYEDAFGEELLGALPEAALLVNVTNDAWFDRSIGPHQHLQMARMRALETGRPLLRATNTGVTALVGADGRVLARAPMHQAYALDGAVRPYAGATPYVRLGNAGPVGLASALLLLALLLAVARRRGA